MGIRKPKFEKTPLIIGHVFNALVIAAIVVGLAVIIYNFVVDPVEFDMTIRTSGIHVETAPTRTVSVTLEGGSGETEDAAATMRTFLLGLGIRNNRISTGAPQPVDGSKETVSRTITAEVSDEEAYVSLLDYARGLACTASVDVGTSPADGVAAAQSALAAAYEAALERIEGLSSVFPQLRESSVVRMDEKDVSYDPDTMTTTVVLDTLVHVEGPR